VQDRTDSDSLVFGEDIGMDRVVEFSKLAMVGRAVTPCFPQSVKITILAKYCGKLRNVNV
jgi:hypothetical protein